MAAGDNIGTVGVLLTADTAHFEKGLSRAAAIAERELARTERANKAAGKEADRFVGVIQRQIETFGLSGTALLRYEAGLKGVSDRAGPLIDKLEAMKKAAADTGTVRPLDGISSGLKAAGAALAAYASVDVFKGLILGAVNAADRLNDLSKSTGIAVETLGGIGFAAGQAGTDLEGVAASLGKLNLSIAKAATGDKELSAAFDAVGISVKDAAGATKAADVVFAELAGKFASYADGPEKAALGNALFGKSYSSIIPLLNDGGQALAQNTEYYKRFGGVTAATAAQADEFNDTLGKINLIGGAFGRTLAGELLPSMKNLADSLLSAKEQGFGFESVAVGIRNVLEGVAVVGANVGFVLLGIGREIGAIAAQGAALARLDFRGFSVIGDAVKEDGARARAELDKFTAGFQKSADTVKDIAERNRLSDLVGGLAEPKRAAPRLPGAGGGGGGSRGRSGGAADDPAKAALTEGLREQERAIAAERDLGQQRNRFLDLYNAQGLVSIQSYYDARRAILDAATSSQVAAYDKEIAALQAFQAKRAKATERAETQGKINDATDKRDKLLRDAGSAVIELSVQQENAQEALRKSIAGVTAELLQQQGQLAKAAAQRFDDTNKPLVRSLTANGDTAALADVERLRAYTIAQAEYTQQATEATRVTEALAAAEARIALAERLGATTTLGALQQVGAARQAALAQMDAIVAAEEAIAKASANPALIAQAEKARLALEQLRGTADVLGDRFKTIFDSAGADAFAGFIDGSKTASQAFSQFANSILRDLSRIASQQITSGLIGQGGFLSGLLKSAVGFFSGSGGSGGSGNVSSGLNANGNVYDRGLQKFASGGIFDKPTAFRFAQGAGFARGIMGEAGPEAVMPLKRSADGKLGVVAQGVGGGDTYINIHNNAGAQVEARETRRPGGGRDIDIFVNQVKQAVARDIQSGGDVAGALQGTYGLNRAAGVMRGA